MIRALRNAYHACINDGRYAEIADLFAAGADVVQLYSGLVYTGPELVTQAAQALKNLR